MKNVLFLFLISISFLGSVSAQSIGDDSLQPTKLGKWKKPTPTKIAKVDAYIDTCADVYQEAMDIRKQYAGIDTLKLNVGEVMAIVGNDAEVIKTKKAEYEALLDRIKAQENTFTKLPEMAEAAVKAIPVGLKAISATKAVTSTKSALQLTVEENMALLKAVTKQITSLSAAPVMEQSEEDTPAHAE
ncbi:MAG: hypothetical protein ACLUH6_06085 [Bacteroides faecis]